MCKVSLYAIVAAIELAAVGNPQTLSAQTIANGNVLVNNILTNKDGKQMDISFYLDMSTLKLKKEHKLRFTPLMVNGTDTLALSPIVVNGKSQHIRYQRNPKQEEQGTTVVCRQNGESQQLQYSQKVDYKPWMSQFDLAMHEDLCGCGNKLSEDNTPIKHVDNRPARPEVSFVKPKAEAIKTRAEKGQAYIIFPVNKWDILTNFHENTTELNKITSTIDLVKNDKNVEITGIDIHGYASPEGSYANNTKLANNRAAAVSNYVKNLYRIDSNLFTHHATPEDWEGLKAKLAESSLEERQALLKIAGDNSLNPDERDHKMRRIYPEAYAIMLNTIYPRLRHSDYTVTYTVRPFSIDEAKELLRNKPQMLSLQEMFLVAQTYEPGSQEFNEVFNIAVRLFPNDETANLNAACTYIQQGNIEQAERHLVKAGNSPEANQARKAVEQLRKYRAEYGDDYLKELK